MILLQAGQIERETVELTEGPSKRARGIVLVVTALVAITIVFVANRADPAEAGYAHTWDVSPHCHRQVDVIDYPQGGSWLYVQLLAQVSDWKTGSHVYCSTSDPTLKFYEPPFGLLTETRSCTHQSSTTNCGFNRSYVVSCHSGKMGGATHGGCH
ncbi:MAG: hypothetical protein DWP92_06225 [Armatimonadetes bacterium]|nr:MAG: hypothetical protein DWP92_06225 [Armatimonadota bacterium]